MVLMSRTSAVWAGEEKPATASDTPAAEPARLPLTDKPVPVHALDAPVQEIRAADPRVARGGGTLLDRRGGRGRMKHWALGSGARIASPAVRGGRQP